MKWNWFAPLPPAKSGIADFTVNLLPTLAAHVELTLWTDQTEWDLAIEKYAEVRQFKELPSRELNRVELNIYHLGNDATFHSSIWEVASRHSGLVVLHDICLQHFFAGLAREGPQNQEAYLESMLRLHGEEGLAAALDYVKNGVFDFAFSERFPLTSRPLENALGVLVHTSAAFDSISQEARLPVIYSPLPYTPQIRSVKNDSADLTPQVSPVLRLIMCGFIGLNRRLQSILRAIGSFPERSRLHLDVYGTIAELKSVEKDINLLGITDLVTLHGYCSESVLDKAFSEADLALNLRFPTMGECSLSQLRFWEHALPTLVTPVGWYASLPRDTVAYVHQENEESDLHHHFTEYLTTPEIYRRMGQNGRSYLLENHSAEKYVKGISDFASDSKHHHMRRMSSYLAARVGEVYGQWHSDVSQDVLFARAAQNILSISGCEQST